MDYAQNMLTEAARTARTAQAAKLGRSASARYRSLEEVKAVARDFEAFFVQYMIRAMRKSVPETGLLSGGRAEEIFRDLFDREVAGSAVEKQDFGIARMVVESLSDKLPPGEREKAVEFVKSTAARRQAAHAYRPLPDREGTKWYSLR